jgi:putative Holliday junction resolvase
MRNSVDSNSTTPVTPSFPALGIDYGLKHVGLAFSDQNGVMAGPLPTFHMPKDNAKKALLLELKKIILEYKVKTIVIGKPQNFVEKKSESERRIDNFATWLGENISLPIIFYDESFSTKNAQNMLLSIGISQKKSRNKIDSMACTVFLQEFLDSQKR